MHSVNGLRNRSITIEDGEIKLIDVQATITIGAIETLLSLPPYHDGTYETVNGLEIDIEEYIEHLTIPGKYAKKLKHASPTTESEEDLSDRMIQFNKYLHDKLEGDIKW